MGIEPGGFTRKVLRRIERAVALLETVYQPAGIIPTVRQLFYALANISKEFNLDVPKDKHGYDRVQDNLKNAREKGLYPWSGISDGLRELQIPQTWPRLRDFLETVRDAYVRDKWASQPRRVEVWVEKHALVGTIEAVTTELEIPFLCGRGYMSVTAKNLASLRIAEQPRTILYLGDHDPSGLQMEEEMEAWIQERLPSGLDFRIERIGITHADFANPDLVHLPVNEDDNRTKAYIRRFPAATVVEIEALAPEVLQARLRAAILRHREPEAWARAERQEQRERRKLTGLLRRR